MGSHDVEHRSEQMRPSFDGVHSAHLLQHSQRSPTTTSRKLRCIPERGEVNGCGLSFVIVRTQDKSHLVGVSGSENLFFDAAKKNVFSLLKVGGIYDGARQPVSYAWIETGIYGKTTSFSKQGPGEDPASFLAVKYSDAGTALIPGHMAAMGFALGVTFGDQ